MSLGKGEAVSSILTGSTILHLTGKPRRTWRAQGPNPCGGAGHCFANRRRRGARWCIARKPPRRMARCMEIGVGY